MTVDTGPVPKLGGPQAGENTFRWATVTETHPLRILFDGDTVPADRTPWNLAGAVAVGQRVWVQLFKRRLVVLGVAAVGDTSMVRRVGTVKATTATSPSTSPYPVCSFVIPAAVAVPGYTFRVEALSNFTPNTSGMFTEFVLNQGPSITTGGLQFAGAHIDHRAAARVVAGVVYGEFDYVGVHGAVDHRIVCVAKPSGGGSNRNASITQPATMTVDLVT